jgi:hypothetical protein
MNDIVDNVLINLRTKRYLTQYDYLELELEETQYMFDKYNKQFLKEYYNVDEPSEPKIVIPSESDIEHMDLGEIDAEIQEPEEPDDIQLKKLYRLLSLKTHPDKNNGSQESKEIFAEINKAYKDKNILKLFKFALQYKIEINPIIIEKCTALFENSIKEMQDKIEHIKKTVAWNWGISSEEEKELHREILKRANM